VDKEVYGDILIAVSTATNALVDNNLDLCSFSLSLSLSLSLLLLTCLHDYYDNDARNFIASFFFREKKSMKTLVFHIISITYVCKLSA